MCTLFCMGSREVQVVYNFETWPAPRETMKTSSWDRQTNSSQNLRKSEIFKRLTLDMITWRLAWRTPIGSWRGQRSPVPMTMRPGDSHATIGWQWTRGTGELTGICTLNRSDRQKIASQFFCSFQNRSSYMCIVLLLKYITQQLASPSRKTIAYFKPTLSHPTNYLPLSIF